MNLIARFKNIIVVYGHIIEFGYNYKVTFK